MTAGDTDSGTDSNAMSCPGTSPDTDCEQCLADNCCGAYQACEDDVACACTLQCNNIVCALGCNVNLKNLAGLLDYLAGLGLVENGNDGCLLDQCGVLCPVAGLL